MIRLRDVHLELDGPAGRVAILRGIDLEIESGESVALTGPSGAGKSTLLAVIAGIERPSRGRVEVAGRDLAALDEDGLALFRRRHIGLLFQAFHLLPHLSALENVALPLELLGRRDAPARARELLAEVGLADRTAHYPAQLSGGEQQRVALARALAADPPLLLADEPTGNLDSTTSSRVLERMFALCARRGATILLVTHEPEVAARCARRLLMRDGRLEGAG